MPENLTYEDHIKNSYLLSQIFKTKQTLFFQNINLNSLILSDRVKAWNIIIIIFWRLSQRHIGCLLQSLICSPKRLNYNL